AGLGALKWGRFRAATTPIPRPDGTPGVGAFEGGQYHRSGIYRPTFNCVMRTFGLFCPVCADAMFDRFSTAVQQARPSTVTLTSPRSGQRVGPMFLAAFAIDDFSRV